jgi:hypothetical protein
VYDTNEQAKLADQFGEREGPSPVSKMKPVRAGKICWRPLSPFSLLVPPGVQDEGSFPWECVVRPARLTDIKAQFGVAANDLKEDRDIGSLLGLDVNSESNITLVTRRPQGGLKPTTVRDHIWLFTYFEKPPPKTTRTGVSSRSPATR